MNAEDYLVYPMIMLVGNFVNFSDVAIRVQFSLILRVPAPVNLHFARVISGRDYTGFPPATSVCSEIKGC